MEIKPADLRDLPSVKQFVACGDIFCALLEYSGDWPPSDFLNQLAIAMANLYAAALTLPDVEVKDSPVNEKTKSSERKVLSADGLRALRHKLGDFETYWQVHNPYEDDVPVRAGIIDDLGDIYHDYRRYLDIYRGGSDHEVSEAVWHWKFMFEEHWGDHLVDSLRAIHRLITRIQYGFRPRIPDDDLETRGGIE